MPRRRRGGVIDADRADDAIEILDLDADRYGVEEEVIESESATSLSPFAALAGVIVAAVATFGVITAGNTPAPEPPSPSVTVPVETLSPEEAARAAEVAELEATYGVEIGNGPGLDWQPIVWNIDGSDFTWIDDGFVADNGATEWTIRPSLVGPTVSQRESLELQFPGYSMHTVDGARLLVPAQDTDHILVVAGDREPVRVELPPFQNPPTSDVVRAVRAWPDGIVVDDRLVSAYYEFLEIDPDVLGARIGQDLSDADFIAIGPDGFRPRSVVDGTVLEGDAEPILFEDAGLTDAEVADIQSIDNQTFPAVSLSIDLESGQAVGIELDDLVWVQSYGRTAAGAALAWDDIDAQQWLSTSIDGITWSTKPITADEGSVWFAGPRIYTFPVAGPSSIRRSGDLGRTWQRTRRPFPASSINAAIDDVLIVTEAPSIDGDVPDLAITRWDPSADDPEWRIEPLADVFNNGVDVTFVVGDGHILAEVTTEDGMALYLAETRQS